MVVIPADKDFEPWLYGKAGVELLKSVPDGALGRWPVSMRVNSSKAPTDDPTLIGRFQSRVRFLSAFGRCYCDHADGWLTCRGDATRPLLITSTEHQRVEFDFKPRSLNWGFLF